MSGHTAALPQRRPRFGSRLMIAIQLLLAIGLLTGILLSMRGNTGQKMNMPEEVDGMKLVKMAEGKAAVAQMDQLHGTDVGVVDGYTAEYSRPGHKLTVWYGRTGGEEAAAELLRVMTEKIGKGNPMFTGLQKLTVEGKVVFSVKSSDSSHFYYQSGDAVVWLAIQAASPMQVLTEALKVLEGRLHD